MSLGGVEMGVAGKDVALLDNAGEKHVLSGTALVCGKHVGKSGQHLYSIFQPVERTGAGITLVALHDGGPLLVAHGACAGVGKQVDEHIVALQQEGPLLVAHGACTGVGQQVDEYIVALQQEEVVLGLFNPFLALLAGAFSDGLHHLDSVRFCKRKFHKYLFLKVIPKKSYPQNYE